MFKFTSIMFLGLALSISRVLGQTATYTVSLTSGTTVIASKSSPDPVPVGFPLSFYFEAENSDYKLAGFEEATLTVEGSCPSGLLGRGRTCKV
jgi:hypothetical protein